MPRITNDGYAIKVVRSLREYSRRTLADLARLPERRLASIEYGAPARPDELARIWGALTSDPPNEDASHRLRRHTTPAGRPR